MRWTQRDQVASQLYQVISYVPLLPLCPLRGMKPGNVVGKENLGGDRGPTSTMVRTQSWFWVR